ncbi:hypothetical protein [Nocardia australiensis]|uniref:hypothetical protein n=1 Tax=Nocardia australiensis TaxID=2887191 RepID=UPI001D152892|nr:hypothetical protein [Nocardia australiensis]
MTVTVRVGAVHLGWDVVSVAAGGGGTPIRPVQVEGTYTPPAYLLADASGRLHTAGVERQRPDLGMAIADVRDILGHPQIVIAGATWPAELVMRARMYNPLAAIGKYLRGKPDVVALPFPDGWPDEKVEVYAELVEQLDVTVEPLPESIALSGYVRALGLVRAPDERNPHGIGATGVYSDGRTMLVVAVHGDDEQPTESVDVPVTAESMRDARSADNVVIEVMAAARSIGADTSTVLLSGNVCFNDALRLAFQNHLGHRLQVADHPMHALVLGAAHLLATDNENGEPESGGRHAEPAPARTPAPPPRPAQRPVEAAEYQAEPARQQGIPAQRPAESAPRQPDQAQRQPDPAQRQPDRSQPQSPVQYGPGYPTAGPEPSHEPTTRISRDSLPPGLAELGSRFTRPPGQQPDEQREHPPGPPQASPPGSPAASSPVPSLGSRTPYGAPPAGSQQQQPGAWQEHDSEDDDDKPRKGKRWNKLKDNLFGAHVVIGAVALAVCAMPSDGDRTPPEIAAVGLVSMFCELTPQVTNEHRPGIASVRGFPAGSFVRDDSARDTDAADCASPSIDTLRYRVPGPAGAVDPGPPIEI